MLPSSSCSSRVTESSMWKRDGFVTPEDPSTSSVTNNNTNRRPVLSPTSLRDRSPVIVRRQPMMRKRSKQYHIIQAYTHPLSSAGLIAFPGMFNWPKVRIGSLVGYFSADPASLMSHIRFYRSQETGVSSISGDTI